MRPYGRRKRENDASVGLGCCSLLPRMEILRVLQGDISLATDQPQPTSLCTFLTDMHNCQLLCRVEDELAGIAALEDAVLEWRNAPRKSKGEQPEWFHPLRSLVQAGIPMVCFLSLADVHLYHLIRYPGLSDVSFWARHMLYNVRSHRPGLC